APGAASHRAWNPAARCRGTPDAACGWRSPPAQNRNRAQCASRTPRRRGYPPRDREYRLRHRQSECHWPWVTPVLSVAGFGFDFFFIIGRRCHRIGFSNLRLWFLALFARLLCLSGDGKAQPHPGPALAGPEVGGVLEFDTATMVLEHATDDRKP